MNQEQFPNTVHYVVPQQFLQDHSLGAEHSRKWPALHGNNMQSDYQTTQKLCIYTKIFQTTSFRLNQLVQFMSNTS